MRSLIKYAGLLGLALQSVRAGFDSASSCGAGNYLRGGAVCRTCSMGYYCPGGAEWNMRKCDQGYFSSYGASVCTICPEGFYCPVENGISMPPLPCPATQYSPAGAKDCQNTPDGSVSRLGRLVICPGGTQCDNRSSIQGEPRICRSGYKCDGTNESQCGSGQWTMNIIPGTATRAGSSQCFDCPPGYKCPSKNHPPIPCPPGQYPNTSTSCQLCDAGYECPGGMKMYPKATGLTSAADIIRPNLRRKCPIGTFAPVQGFAFCADCPAGFSCADPAQYPVKCPAGTQGQETYSLVGWAHCGLCPPGKACFRQTNSADCPAGYYSLEGDLHCIACPAGTECRLSTQLPQKCMPGYYSYGKVTACTICPAGKFCGRPDAEPATCPEGHAALLAGSAFCVRIGGGSKTEDNGLTIVTCPTTGGTQISNMVGARHCELCPAGYTCPGLQFEKIVPCEAGYYSKLGDIECQVIMAGYYVANTGTTNVVVGNTLYDPVAVGTGYQTDVGSATRYKCPPGFRCADAWRRHNIHCRPGSFYAIHTDICTICPKGKYCPADIGGYRPAGIDCPDGTYNFSAKGATECKVCPPGYQCSDKTLAPVPCDGNQYQPGGHKDCITVPVGFESNFGQTIAPCPGQFYAKVGSGAGKPGGIGAGGVAEAPTASGEGANCKPCPAGHNCYTPDGTNALGTSQSQKDPEACLAGYYSSAHDLRCVECPKGHSCAATAQFATVCAAGTYNSKTREATCATCPTGFYSLAGAEYCTPIPKGWKAKKVLTKNTDIELCPQKTYSDLGEETCSPCADGFLCPAGTGEASQWEFSCPRGSWCVAGVQTKCPVGFFGTMERAINQAQGCSECPPGYNCPPGTADFMVNPCPKGAYCVKGVAMVACPENTNNETMYGRSVADCQRCGAGLKCGAPDPTAAPAGAVDKGTPCAENSWCGSGLWGYCAEGTYGGYKTGKTSPDQCLLCPPGHYCPRPTKSTDTALPTPAPAGYYTPLTGVRELKGLFKCPPGFYCPDTGMAIYKGYHCQAGYVCPAGSKLATEVKCPEGTWSDRIGLSDIEQCQPCPAGYKCKENSTSTNGQIVVCPINQYCPMGTSFSDTAKCPAGTFTGGHTKAKRLIDCLPCTPGSYCLAGAAPAACNAGHYCPEGTRFATQYACPAGFYNPDTGKASVVDCLHCGIGKYCPDKARTTPGIYCSAGTYNNISTSAIICEICPAGNFCLAPADNAGEVENAEPAPCQPGFYSARGATISTACTLCPVGHYCPLPGTSDTVMRDNVCPEGTYCHRIHTYLGTKYEVGLETYPSSETNKCPRYKYCPKGLSIGADPKTATCVVTAALAPDTANCAAIIGVPLVTDNTACIAVQKAVGGGAACTWTRLATFLEPSLYSNLPKVPPGLSQRFYSVGKISQAEAMPAGFYYTEKAADDVTPLDKCTKGHYCPAGTVTPVPCPTGTYRNDFFGTDVNQCGLCPSGTYCPTEGMSLPTVCPIGNYCPEGSIFVSPCPPGTYNILTGLYDSRECQSCSAGFFCPDSGMRQLPSTYLISGAGPTCARTQTEGTCAETAGTSIAADAAACAAITGVGLQTSTLCIAVPLAAGGGLACTYTPPDATDATNCSAVTALDDNTACLAVVKAVGGGVACTYNGTDTRVYRYQCDAGFICFGGSSRPEPTDEVTGTYCPQGGYCPAGVNRDRSLALCSAVAPAGYFGGCQCVPGQFGLYKGAQEATECTSCWPGYYCAGVSGPDAKKQCRAGVVCAAGATADTVAGDGVAVSLPPKGSYASIQSAQAWKCAIGSYSKEVGVKECLACDAGVICDKPGRIDQAWANTDATTRQGWLICKKGFWCPSLAERAANPDPLKRFYEMEPCEKGKYNPATNKILESDCLACPAGKACNEKGMGVGVDDTTPVVLPVCAMGFFCLSSSPSTHPYTSTTNYGPCPAGKHCGLENSVPVDCLAGTYSNQERAIDASYCLPCPPGYLCTTAGLTAPEKFCPFGSQCKTTGITGSSTQCNTTGHYCALGSHEELVCPAGFYNSSPGSARCQPCPAGQYCMGGSPAACPKGYYCP